MWTTYRYGCWCEGLVLLEPGYDTSIPLLVGIHIQVVAGYNHQPRGSELWIQVEVSTVLIQEILYSSTDTDMRSSNTIYTVAGYNHQPRGSELWRQVEISTVLPQEIL